MNKALRNQLIDLAKKRIKSDDPSHDFEHALRVLSNAERIAREERADLDIIVPAALFHDIVSWPKNHPRATFSSEESAKKLKKILTDMNYPKDKIKKACYAVQVCSFSKGIVPHLLEAKILQDADFLEATGAIIVMRCFASTGQMKRPFYHPADPFCTTRQPAPMKYALDVFYDRSFKIESRIHTKAGKQIARRRLKYLRAFLFELKEELEGK